MNIIRLLLVDLGSPNIHKGARNQINIRILHFGPKAQDEGDSIFFRILMLGLRGLFDPSAYLKIMLTARPNTTDATKRGTNISAPLVLNGVVKISNLPLSLWQSCLRIPYLRIQVPSQKVSTQNHDKGYWQRTAVFSASAQTIEPRLPA